ncbi:protein phosphatase methylesterase [Schizophyllum commune H4-8]|uniref:protein phosphatase methylesterase n=1 Tax=Schizophyllum commune (strain H4-8 / FGSC 9210) TaxID=578458 RepID=UPI00215F5BD0|nr:protein phosphatase methylesterase [Schizophyllum commune H4-8]KAI5886219.1 protein phosphatase methylesterase [Schizophyllum commune H4-8]
MSDLYRSAMSARIAKLPPDLPPGDDFVTRAPGFGDGVNRAPAFDDDDDEEFETDGLGDLPNSGLGPPAVPPNPHLQRLDPRARNQNPTYNKRNTREHKPNPAFAPLSAAGLFAESAQIPLPDRGLDMRVYYTAAGSPTGPLLVAHHGAGYSGLSFACFAGEITSTTRGELGVLALDARRHGKTTSLVDPEPEDLSITTLVDDLVALLTTMFPDPARAPGFLLTGHSMGGSVVTRACAVLVGRKYRLIGVSVLDAVEGHALPALPAMHGLLAGRPEGFRCLEDAVGWHIQTKTIRNVHSARISIPPIFVEAKPAPDGRPPPYKYVWRTPLRTTAAYWRGWFEGLSQAFLDARTARLLVLAGTDRLDKPLMIGQMQGRFQLEVVPDVGHLLHEDNPTKLAEIHVNFWRRNERVLVGVKKVGEE